MLAYIAYMDPMVPQKMVYHRNHARPQTDLMPFCWSQSDYDWAFDTWMKYVKLEMTFGTVKARVIPVISTKKTHQNRMYNAIEITNN